MPDDRQQQFNVAAPSHALSEIISPLRLGTYLNAAGHDFNRALQLYLWNAQVGEAFHIPIQSVEVGLRNRVSDGLQAAYGSEWWKEQSFLNIAESKRASDIDLVKHRLRKQSRPLETGRIIAGLSFVFWIAMLDGRYNPPIWGAFLRVAFPHLPPEIDRDKLHREAGRIADLRNRIWHHEPIFRRNLSGDYSRCMRVLNWLCPVKASWVKPHCRVPQMLRQKP